MRARAAGCAAAAAAARVACRAQQMRRAQPQRRAQGSRLAEARANDSSGPLKARAPAAVPGAGGGPTRGPPLRPWPRRRGAPCSAQAMCDVNPRKNCLLVRQDDSRSSTMTSVCVRYQARVPRALQGVARGQLPPPGHRRVCTGRRPPPASPARSAQRDNRATPASAGAGNGREPKSLQIKLMGQQAGGACACVGAPAHAPPHPTPTACSALRHVGGRGTQTATTFGYHM